MRGRIITAAAAGVAMAAGFAQADEVGGEDIMIIEPEPTVVEVETVTAAPPPYVTIESRSVAAGLGISWGDGTLLFEGRRHPFSVKGVSLGDLGTSLMNAEGRVENLERLSDFAGSYVAVEARAAAGVGAGALTMRNEHGVVITLTSRLEGVQLTLGAEGFRIALD